jgi:hypothetical protein
MNYEFSLENYQEMNGIFKLFFSIVRKASKLGVRPLLSIL